jgi:hypothetical protein
MRKPGTLTITQSTDAFYSRAVHAEETQEAMHVCGSECIYKNAHGRSLVVHIIPTNAFVCQHTHKCIFSPKR